jgi:fructuronate reductase
MRFMLKEQMPTLPASDHDIPAYARQLLERWRNPGIVHQLGRVGRNHSEKLQARLLGSLRDNLAAGVSAPCTLIALGAWLTCVTGPAGQAFEDPMSARLQQLGRDNPEPEALVEAVLRIETLLSADLRQSSYVREGLMRAVTLLRRMGPRNAVKWLLSEPGRQAFEIQ